MKQDLVASLDMGSGRVTCLIGAPEASTGAIKVLGGSSVVCRGLKGGVVIDIIDAASAVTRAVEEAEAGANATVSQVWLGVRGNHLQSFNNRGAYNIARTDREITADDVSAVVANARAIPLSSDREILHVVPQGFSLDRQRGVPHPVGMEASLLEVDVHLVTSSSAHLNNIMKTVARAGFQVIEPVYGLLAAGELLVTQEEKELGCVLVDLGGQSISLGVYCEGAIKYSKEIAFGSDFITRDLAVGLKTSIATAERIKIEHGIAHPGLLNGDADIECHGIDGRTPLRVKSSTMMGIILPRVEEIFSVVAEDLQNSSFADVVAPGGAILTGGGSLMRGTIDAAQQVLGVPVRRGVPHPDAVMADEAWLSPAYSTALGLLQYSTSPRWGGIDTRSVARKRPLWMRKIAGMIEELF
ncbi:MAG: cell division protein FtsA [Elusimicrobia bacterium RIFOXYD12_FULL_66_9]|nr:MAG: cell division protein FtsA [Elusimicrobia bacterium RIFOXYD12_FULL_66_9]